MMAAEVRYKYYSAVKERPVSWLWYPYIPYGKVTVLQGDPGEVSPLLWFILLRPCPRG